MKPVEACAHAGSDPSRDGLLICGLIVAILDIGRPILEPLVIAALLAFILSPLIRRLRQWGVWRAPSVVLAVVFTLGVLGALGTIIAIQITQLAEELPTYETNLRTKIRTLGTGGLTSGALERASGTLKVFRRKSARRRRVPRQGKSQCWWKCANRSRVALRPSPTWCVRCCHHWR
jgi:hypothetical protein